jgi:hypothetical protein
LQQIIDNARKIAVLKDCNWKQSRQKLPTFSW